MNTLQQEQLKLLNGLADDMPIEMNAGQLRALLATARAEGAAEVLQIIKGVTYYVEYPVETFEYDRMVGKVIVGSHENPIEMLSKRDVEVFNATAKMIWGKVNKNIEALTTKEIDHAEE